MYAQYGEEDFLNKIFPNKKNGLVVDIGAADGIRFSNSRYLIELGWSAILVEPNRNNFEKLQKLYHNTDNVKLINTGCGNISQSNVSFYIDKNDEHEQLSTFKVNQMEKCKSIYNCDFVTTEIDIIKTSELFKKNNIEYVDFLSIDTEDFDETVIQGIDFDSVNIHLICVEHNTKVIQDILNKNNYEMVYKTVGNIFYRKK